MLKVSEISPCEHELIMCRFCVLFFGPHQSMVRQVKTSISCSATFTLGGSVWFLTCFTLFPGSTIVFVSVVVTDCDYCLLEIFNRKRLLEVRFSFFLCRLQQLQIFHSLPRIRDALLLFHRRHRSPVLYQILEGLLVRIVSHFYILTTH